MVMGELVETTVRVTREAEQDPEALALMCERALRRQVTTPLGVDVDPMDELDYWREHAPKDWGYRRVGKLDDDGIVSYTVVGL